MTLDSFRYFVLLDFILLSLKFLRIYCYFLLLSNDSFSSCSFYRRLRIKFISSQSYFVESLSHYERFLALKLSWFSKILYLSSLYLFSSYIRLIVFFNFISKAWSTFDDQYLTPVPNSLTLTSNRYTFLSTTAYLKIALFIISEFIFEDTNMILYDRYNKYLFISKLFSSFSN